MYILYKKNKKNKKNKLKMVGWYHDLFILKKYGCSQPYKFNYFVKDTKEDIIKNVKEM